MRAHAFIVALCLSAAAAAGQIYTWKDKDGKVHYSDTPPPGNVQGRTVATPPPAAGDKGNLANQELEFRKRRAAAAEAEAKERQASAEARDKRANCELARNQLAALESGARVARTNAQGEREYLDDAQREQEIARARKAADSWCK